MSPQRNALTGFRQFAHNRFLELAWGGLFSLVLGMSQAQAISLEQIRVESHLGQPLDAVVYVTPAPGEMLTATCFSAAPAEASELPGIENIKLVLSRKTSPMALRLSTRQAVREPLSEIVLKVRCPGVPSISRTFWVMVNPQAISDNGINESSYAASPTSTSQPSQALRSGPATRERATRSNRPRIASGGERVRVYAAYAGPTDPITPGENYVVRDGDVLSMIASRVAGRASNTVWDIAEKIFTLNPAAFMSGDPNMLIAGSQIYVPLPAVSALPAQRAPTVPAADTVMAPASGVPANAGPVPTAVVATTAAVPAGAGATATPLPAMVLSRSLSALSVSRIEQRRSGVLALPQTLTSGESAQPAVTRTSQLSDSGNSNQAPEIPDDQSAPDVAVTPPKASLAPAASNASSSGFGWTAFFALMLLVLVGVPIAMFAYRRNVTRAFRDDLRKALRRRRYADELVRSRQQREQADDSYSVTEAELATSPSVIAEPEPEFDQPLPAGLPAGPSAMLADLLDSEQTVKVESPAEKLDLEFPEMTHDVAQSVDSDATDLTIELETTNGGPELDLELPDLFATTAASDEPTASTNVYDGMEALDFDPELLALDYSKEYEASRKAEAEPSDETDPAFEEPPEQTPEDDKSGAETPEFYHLEPEVEIGTEDSSEELLFTDDEDSGNSSDDDDKVVQFPQKLSGQ